MINTYGYGLEEGAKSMTCLNYYTNKDMTIPLEPPAYTSGKMQKNILNAMEN